MDEPAPAAHPDVVETDRALGFGIVVLLLLLLAAPALAECPKPRGTIELSGGFSLCMPAGPGFPAGTPVAMRLGLPDGTLIAGGVGVVGTPLRLEVSPGALEPRAEPFEVETVSMISGVESEPGLTKATYRPE